MPNVKSELKRFSIIMSVYNLENIVSKSIESILNQKFSNYEILIVNDGSTDNTLKVLKEYQKKSNGKIKIINNRKNIGLSASRNKAVAQAKGEYIIYLDGDDTLYNKNTLYRIDSIIGNEDFDIIYFGVQYTGASNKLYLPNAKNSSREARIACDMHFAVSSKVWRRKFLKKNKLTFVEGMYYEDMIYSIKATIKAKKTTFGSIPIYNYYRNREGSIMSTPNIKRCKDMYKMLYYLMDLYEDTPEIYKPYLLSFIKNETLSVPDRIDVILKSLKDSTYTPIFPKRNYKFLGDTTEIEKQIVPKPNNSIIIPISLPPVKVQNETANINIS